MGLRRIFNEWREKVDGTLTGPALETGGITDSDDGQAWETLRQMGYEVGDYVPMFQIGPANNTVIKINSSSYSGLAGSVRPVIQWNKIAPPSATTAIKVSGEINPRSGEMDIRFRNQDDGENAFELTGLGGSSRNVHFDPQNYTPTTTDSPLRYDLQIRSDGNNTDELFRPIVDVGVKL